LRYRPTELNLRKLEAEAEVDNRVNIVIIFNFILSPKTAGTATEQRAFRCYFSGGPSQAQDFRRARGAARCKFLEEQRKTAGVNPSGFFHRAGLWSPTDNQSACFTQSCGVSSPFPRKREARASEAKAVVLDPRFCGITENLFANARFTLDQALIASLECGA
jgi:hypothetical protein